MMFDEQIITLLADLGTHGINAFYVHMALEYGTLWIFMGLCVWGVRGAWKRLKATTGLENGK